ncbi:ABC transporter permease [Castellaniella sp. WN]
MANSINTGYKPVHFLITVVIFIGIMAIWQSAYSFRWVSHLVLPAPGDVLTALAQGFRVGNWALHMGVTIMEALFAFVIGIAVALVLGTLFAYSNILRLSCYPYVLMGQTFPKIAIAPLLLTWLGYGYSSKIVIGAMLAFFPVFVNTVAGLKSVDGGQVDLLRSMRASAWQEFRYLRLPNATTYIFASMTVAIVSALLGVIVGEFVGARSGLGFLIIQLSTVGDIPGVFGVLAVLSCIALVGYGILFSCQYIVTRAMGGVSGN